MVPDVTARYSHPCSNRAFQDIHVPNFLFSERNTKKIPIDFTGQLQEQLKNRAAARSIRRMLRILPEMIHVTAEFKRRAGHQKTVKTSRKQRFSDYTTKTGELQGKSQNRHARQTIQTRHTGRADYAFTPFMTLKAASCLKEPRTGRFRANYSLKSPVSRTGGTASGGCRGIPRVEGGFAVPAAYWICPTRLSAQRQNQEP